MHLCSNLIHSVGGISIISLHMHAPEVSIIIILASDKQHYIESLQAALPCRAGLQVPCSCSTCQLSSAHWAIPVAPRGCPFEIRPPLQQRQREHTDQQQQVSDTHTVYAIVSLPLTSPSDHSHLPFRPLPPPLLTTPTSPSDHSHFPSGHSHLPFRPLPPPLQTTPTSPSGHSHLPFRSLPPPPQATPTSPSDHSHPQSSGQRRKAGRGTGNEAM